MKIFETIDEEVGVTRKVKDVLGTQVEFFVKKPNLKQMAHYESLALKATKTNNTLEVKRWSVNNLVCDKDGTQWFPQDQREKANKEFQKRPTLFNALFEGVSEVINGSSPDEGDLNDMGES